MTDKKKKPLKSGQSFFADKKPGRKLCPKCLEYFAGYRGKYCKACAKELKLI